MKKTTQTVAVATTATPKKTAAKKTAKVTTTAIAGTPVAKPAKIGITAAAEMILASKGKIFSVNVKTKENPDRKMTCRLTKACVQPGTIGAKKKVIGQLTVKDVQAKDFRTINLQEVTSLRINKEVYTIRK